MMENEKAEIAGLVIGGVMEDGKKLNTELGTVQGGLISPVLANVYLHYVLDTWFVHISEREYSGEMYMVRYEAEQETGGTLSILRDIWKLDQHCMAQSIPHQRLLKRK